MSNFLYDNARKNFAMGHIRWRSLGGDTFRFLFIDHEYIPDQVNHETLVDIPLQYRYGRESLGLPTDGFELIINDPINGICDAQDITITGLQTGLRIGYILIYKEGITDSDSLLLSLISMGQGMPFTTDSTDIFIEWNNTQVKLFRI